MITAIVLAAGLGKRMGQQKLLLPCGNVTLIEHIVHQVIQGGVDACVVVTGGDHDRIKPLVESLGGHAVQNAHPIEGGMLSSVRCGLSQAASNSTGYLVCLGDQPGISAALVKGMLQKNYHESPAILTPVHQGKRGHPLFFKADFKSEIMDRYDDVGLRGLLTAHSEKITEYECSDEGVLIDLDTPADYGRWMKKQSEGK